MRRQTTKRALRLLCVAVSEDGRYFPSTTFPFKSRTTKSSGFKTSKGITLDAQADDKKSFEAFMESYRKGLGIEHGISLAACAQEVAQGEWVCTTPPISGNAR